MLKNHTLNTFLFFNGRCEEAIEFYRQTVGAQTMMMMRYKDAPPGAVPQSGPPGGENKIMHARIGIGGTTVMLSDGPCSGNYDGFSLSLSVPDVTEAEHLFAALSAGGRVDMPLAKTFFSPGFGMLTDKFGVKWMLMVHPPV